MTAFFARLGILMVVALLSGCRLGGKLEKVDKFGQRLRKMHHYHTVALGLARENRELKAEISRLRFDLQKGKTKRPGRSVASVKFGSYRLQPRQLRALADKQLAAQNWQQAAGYFDTFVRLFPRHPLIDERFLFQAGVAAFESGQTRQAADTYFGRLVRDHPNSTLYRKAKLWRGLAQLKMGEREKFFQVVKEFKRKYRNTDEWKLLSRHYEKIVDQMHPGR